ncbi:MAG: HD domain-containing protein [Planctomycetes bacterium]|nr:HD domain-containing protein [Planctomycetota bacterium]
MCDLHREEELGRPRGGVEELVDELVVALTNARIYGEDHPRLEHSLASLRSSIEALASADGDQPIVLGTAQGVLFYQQRPLLGASLSSAKLIEALTQCRAGALSIHPRAQRYEWKALVEVLAKNKHGYPTLREANEDLAGRGCKQIEFLPEFRSAGTAPQHGDPGPRPRLGVVDPGRARTQFKVPLELYQQTVVLLQESAARASHREDVDLERTKGFVEAILSGLVKDAPTMLRLARYERYDAYTFGHSIRVCFLALNFAATLYKDEETLLRIGMAALLHDIGKARVPFEVLHSTSRLSDEERAVMSLHTNHGGEILLASADSDPLSVASAFGHHQTLDGGGYPRTLHPVRQSGATRIVKICDVFEALTAVRPYKPRMSAAKAFRVMLSMQGHFDATLLCQFMRFTGVFPTGTTVRMSTGEQACVLRQTANPLAPLVRIEVDDLGAELQEDPDLIQDLSLPAAAGRWHIAGVIDSAA